MPPAGRLGEASLPYLREISMKVRKGMESASRGGYLHGMALSRFNAFNIPPGTYRVVREFADFDGGVHAPGETWRFLSQNFFPYDAGLTLYLQWDGRERTLRLQDYPDAQGPVIDHFHEYIERVGD